MEYDAELSRVQCGTILVQWILYIHVQDKMCHVNIGPGKNVVP